MSSTSEVTIGGLVGTRWKPSLSVDVTDGIAIITFDLPNESVNKLNRAVKDEFVALVSRLERDTTIQAAVFISGKPDVWIAGADIEEFLALKDEGLRMGFKHVESGPLVRSSYHADEQVPDRSTRG